ncbi:MAG: ABC transporter substrate-binding protein [Steroidobacteraceae bacterium]
MTMGFNRRDLLRSLAGAGLVGTAGGLAGCGIGPADGVAPEYIPYDGSGTPKRGGRIRIASMSSSTADTLDPARGGLSTDYVRHFMLYSGLTMYDNKLVAQPWLAEEIATDDRIHWTFRLRRGVSFHDGRPLTSADVVYSLLRHKDPATASKMKAVAEQITDARAVDPHEVHVTLATANADLPAILAASQFLIVPDGTKDFSRGIGSGPFRLKEFIPGVRTIVARNGDYWRDGRPFLDEIELIGIPDEMARVNALLSGDVQMINAVNPRSTRRIRESPRHALQITKSSLYTNLILRQDMPISRDPDFVLAMKHLIDRETIGRALFRGYSTLANDQPIQPGHRYYLEGLPQRPYDPDRARFHLKRAGLIGVRLPIYASPAAEASVDMAAMLQQSAAKVGLTLAVNRVPADGYWSNHWFKHALTFGNTNPRPTADLLFTTLFKSDAPWNESGWKNEQFDQLLVAARGEGDETRRRQMYGDMQVLVHDHCGIGIPAYIDFIDGLDRRIKGYGPLPLGGFMGYQFAEHVWLDDGNA